MNSDKQKSKKQGGNAIIYVLLCLGLLAALTMYMADQNDQAGSESTADEETEIMATRVVGFAGVAKNVIDQMIMSGTDVASLDFIRPNTASYEAAPHINKVFHPGGGNLILDNAATPIFSGALITPARGWYFNAQTNIEWTPTTANDVMIVAYGIPSSVCQSLNKKIKNDVTVPVITGTFEDVLLTADDGGGGDSLDTTACAACVGYPSLCVSDSGATTFAYYSVIEAQ